MPIGSPVSLQLESAFVGSDGSLLLPSTLPPMVVAAAVVPSPCVLLPVVSVGASPLVSVCSPPSAAAPSSPQPLESATSRPKVSEERDVEQRVRAVATTFTKGGEHSTGSTNNCLGRYRG